MPEKRACAHRRATNHFANGTRCPERILCKKDQFAPSASGEPCCPAPHKDLRPRPERVGADGKDRLRARARNRLDATRTDALLSQSETGKINRVRLPHCGRLPPGACRKETRTGGFGSSMTGAAFVCQFCAGDDPQPEF